MRMKEDGCADPPRGCTLCTETLRRITLLNPARTVSSITIRVAHTEESKMLTKILTYADIATAGLETTAA